MINVMIKNKRNSITAIESFRSIDASRALSSVIFCCSSAGLICSDPLDSEASAFGGTFFVFLELIIKINDLEEKSDKLFIDSMRSLHTESSDPLHIIAWREIYEYLEKCADACEHVADIIESVVMKNS